MGCSPMRIRNWPGKKVLFSGRFRYFLSFSHNVGHKYVHKIRLELTSPVHLFCEYVTHFPHCSTKRSVFSIENLKIRRASFCFSVKGEWKTKRNISCRLRPSHNFRGSGAQSRVRTDAIRHDDTTMGHGETQEQRHLSWHVLEAPQATRAVRNDPTVKHGMWRSSCCFAFCFFLDVILFMGWGFQRNWSPGTQPSNAKMVAFWGTIKRIWKSFKIVCVRVWVGEARAGCIYHWMSALPSNNKIWVEHIKQVVKGKLTPKTQLVNRCERTWTKANLPRGIPVQPSLWIHCTGALATLSCPDGRCCLRRRFYA